MGFPKLGIASKGLYGNMGWDAGLRVSGFRGFWVFRV